MTDDLSIEVSPRLERSEMRYRRLFETARDGILILDAETMAVVDANPYMSEILGYSKEEFEGRQLWEIGLFRDRDESKAAIQTLRKTGYIRTDDLPLRTKGGSVLDVEFVSNVYREGDRDVAQCNIRDVSESKRMERQIQRQPGELAEAFRRKDEFLAVLSHELRNPMAAIFNAIHVLGKEGSENASLREEARLIIERQIRHLARLVDDLLETSRIATGRIRLQVERVDVNRIVERAVERMQPSIERRKQKLFVSLLVDPVWLCADPDRLEQVFVNLLDNASKYSDMGGHIRVLITTQGAEAVFRVHDEGIGISSKLLPQVFELFAQDEATLERSEGGLGIGLALVKNLVELHGGSVEAQSDGIGHGSEFIVRLPLMIAETSPTKSRSIP